MKKRQYITLFLFFISLIMLVIPVIPHHHHADGLICMKNDVTTSCCGHQHSNGGDHCCCDTGCMTTHFFQQTPTSNDVWLHPDTPWVVTLLFEPLSKLLILPEFDINRQDCVYLESLHGTFITRATGLRAPPFVLA
ncbi:DUF6769 family protein [Bacteroides sp. GD17]|uniref:DUF6769 family protein n=1 Tax=Bacteroides sp. GD17 TaxID=3139826 RepID=UPI0025F637A1|nr:DUF6769 family protein [uncultured Bacteroides sp.]